MSQDIAGRCRCTRTRHALKLVVLTGGPGAGKTAILELAHRHFCRHVAILPEAASIIFKGGFWRRESAEGKRAAQRAIYHVQRELEGLVLEERDAAVALCDRGTIDGIAYWPGSASSYCRELGTTRRAELHRYAAVIHVRTPPAWEGYNHANPVRVETPREAAEIDRRILEAWRGHPNRVVIGPEPDFMTKAAKALDTIRRSVPECCALR